MLSIHVAMNGASSAAASRSSSWEQAAIDTPSDPGIDAGAIARRESGKLPDPGGGGADARGGGTDAGGDNVARKPRELSEDGRDGITLPDRGTDSVAKVGGGTKARRAIGQ
jgi:hypothetical protein